MKKVLAVGVLFLTVVMYSCTKTIPNYQELELKDGSEYQSHVTLRATDGRALLAKLFATAINEEATAKELLRMVSLERDGDREVLLAEILPNKNLRSASSLYSSLDYAFTAEKGLRSSYENPGVSRFEDFESFANHLISIDPLVQVAVLSKDEEISSVDLKNEDVLTVYLPEDYDDQKDYLLTAYDKSGKIHYLKSSEEPDVPVIVISENERLISVPKGESTYNEMDLKNRYFEGPNHDYYCRPDVLCYAYPESPAPPTPPTPPTPPVPDGKCDREKFPNYADYLEKAKFTSQKTMRKYESYWRGRPEMKYTIIPVKAPAMKIYGDCQNTGWWEGATKDLDIRLFNWNREDLGNHYLVHWTEVDGGSPLIITPKVSGNLFGINIEATFKIKLGSDDDEIGGAIVSYKDNALNGQRYDIGEMFKFWIKVKR